MVFNMRQLLYFSVEKVIVFLLALSWLMPNHYWPWVGFHADLWIGLCLGGYVLLLLAFKRGALSVGKGGAILLVFSFAPLIQYVFGVVFFFGDAVIYSLYFFGFFFLFSIFAKMEDEESYRLIDRLFFAIGVASIISVGLQFFQWFGLIDALGFLAIEANGGRPAANFAQPNNLGTFLLWGIVAFYWFWVRGSISAKVSIFAVAYLLLGVALTQSRTSVLAVVLVVILLALWRHRKNGIAVLCVAASALLWLLCWLKIASFMASFSPLDLMADRFSDATTVFKDPIRFSIYKGLLAASFLKPWFGYGFDGVGEAFFAVAENMPPLGVVVLHTHNIFLDLIIWLGWPIGLMCAFILIRWAVRQYFAALTQERQVLFVFVFVVGLHAMLELPLHYAVFLFPLGMVAGVLSAAREGGAVNIPRWLGGVIVCACIVLAGVIARDYFLVEEKIISLRLSRYNIVAGNKSEVGEIFLLNQFSSFLDFSSKKPTVKVLENDLQLGQRVMSIGFNPLNLLHFIEMLAVAGREDEAKLWMRKSLALVGKHLYEDMGQQWARDGERLAVLTKVKWLPYSAVSHN